MERQAAVARNAKRMTAPKTFPRVAMDLATTVERIQQNFTISDPSLPDCPIVFASDSFLELTQYPRHEVRLPLPSVAPSASQLSIQDLHAASHGPSPWQPYIG